MAAYTADVVSLLIYLVDALPAEADRVFAEAEAGETVLEAPSTALAEVLYSVSRDRDSGALPSRERRRTPDRRSWETDQSRSRQSMMPNWSNARNW